MQKEGIERGTRREAKRRRRRRAASSRGRVSAKKGVKLQQSAQSVVDKTDECECGREFQRKANLKKIGVLSRSWARKK